MEQELLIKEERKGDNLYVYLQGDITKPSGQQLLEWEGWNQQDGFRHLIVDFGQVNYINSAGIAALIRLFRLMTKNGVTCAAYGVSYHYEKMFQMVGLVQYCTLFSSKWAAEQSTE